MALALSYNVENWTEEREKTLIAFFSKHSCLWNRKSKEYKDRTLRCQTLELLRILLCAQPPPTPLTVEDIKNKFKNLRTIFHRQYKLVKASDNDFVPLWKYYQQLMFLTDCWEQDYTSEDPPLSPVTIKQQAPNPPVLMSQSQIQTSSFVPTSYSSSTSSSIPIIFKYHWTEEQECSLISFYSEHHCLWHMKSENYNNRQLRLWLLEALKNQLSDNSVSPSVEDIKNKFKNLRTVFYREHKAVQSSLASDKPYVSKWKYYQHLLFLAESCRLDNSPEHLLVQSYQDGKDVQQGEHTSSFSMNTFSSTFNQSNGNNLHLHDSPYTSSQSETKPKERPAPGNFSSVCPENLHPDSEMATETLLAISSADTKPPTLMSPLTTVSSVEPPSDNKLTAESSCLWTEAKVQALISFYSKHGSLWNHKSDGYRNLKLRQNLLETLSNILSDSETVSVKDIKTKFRNLRTTFQREHKAVSFNKTCGSGDFYLPNWKHYTDLMFLCDEEKLPENYQRLENTSQTLSPSASKHSSSSSSSSSSPCHTGSHVSGRKRGSSPQTSTDGELVEILRTLSRNQSAAPHAGFLKYVEECLNETPQNKVKMMKKRIIDTIHSVMEQF